MFKARSTFWIAQLGGWALLTTLVYLATMVQEPTISRSNLMISTLLFFAFGNIISLSIRYLYIKLGWLNIKLSNIIAKVIGISLLASVIMSLSNYLAARVMFSSDKTLSFSEFILDVSATSLLFILWNGIYFSVHYFERSNKQELNNMILTANNNEIELKNLRSQLNPHFLFNSMNSIRALIDIDPEKAKNNITKLSNLLRKSLVMGGNKLVAFEQELSIVTDYLDLEKTRFEERLNIVFEVDAELNKLPFPPFLLQTLVENAIKHGISVLIEGGTIHVRAINELEQYRIEVENSGSLQPKKTSKKGVGLQNTIRRLAIQYQGKASFEIIQTANNTVVSRIIITK
jgi:sensor histidine kinase YesM